MPARRSTPSATARPASSRSRARTSLPPRSGSCSTTRRGPPRGGRRGALFPWGGRGGRGFLAGGEGDAGLAGGLLGRGVMVGCMPPLWEVRPEDFPLCGEVLDLATGLIVHSRYVEGRVRERGYEG